MKGEMVIVVEGGTEEEEIVEFDCSIKEHVQEFINQGLTAKDAIKEVAKIRNLPKNSVYQEYHTK